MKVNHYEAVPSKPVEMEGAHGCTVRSLLSQADGTPTFAMRQFEVAPGGYTPRHSHDYEHEVFVLEGEGVVFEGDRQHKLATGDVIFVQPNEVHQFRNTGVSPMKFLCLIPNSATGKTVKVAPECGVEKM
jgi:quercetin dioxygenase-like cupin family protein